MRRRRALEQDKFLSGVKTVQILQFAWHDLKKKFLSAPTITKLITKFCRDFWTGQTNFVSPVRPDPYWVHNNTPYLTYLQHRQKLLLTKIKHGGYFE